MDRPDREKLFDLFLKSDLRDSCGGHVGWIDGIIDQILALIPNVDKVVAEIMFEEEDVHIFDTSYGYNQVRIDYVFLNEDSEIWQALKSRKLGDTPLP